MGERRDLPIGVMDSGLGGVSVLRLAAQRLPHERFLYYGDTANVPYGEKSLAHIQELALDGAQLLADRGVKALLVACNTATSAAIELLRRRFPFPIVGMEPALKPAVEAHRPGAIVVMATPATLKLERFEHLMSRFAAGEPVVKLPCPGLALAVERDGPGSPALRAMLAELLAPLAGRSVGAIVLGCTHYLFITRDIAALLPGVPQVDGNLGTVRQLERVLAADGLLQRVPSPSPRVEMISSSPDPSATRLFWEFFTMGALGH